MLRASPAQWSNQECAAVADQVGKIFADQIMHRLMALRKA
jgi:hypothetical protein